MSRLTTRDGIAEPVSRDQILRRERGQGNIHFPCSADHEQGGNLTRLILTLAIIWDDHTYYILHKHYIRVAELHSISLEYNVNREIFIFPVQLTTSRVATLLSDPYSCYYM